MDEQSVIRRAARSATAPVRDYVNNHFEMVKAEVRNANAARPDAAAPDWDRIAELESMLAEQALHQARLLARFTDELSRLTDRLGELEHTVQQLALVVAAPVADG